MNELLRTDNLTKQYRTFSLQGISFALPQGYIMGLIGPNGAGKTTIIRLILGLAAANSGKIELLGKPAGAARTREEVGVVFDVSFFPENWRTGEVEKFAGGFYRRWDGARYASLLEKFGLPKTKKIKELSRGMQMKLMLAFAFSHDAKLLILDEPTSGLDPVSRDELLELLLDFIADGQRSVLFSTHISSDLEKVADYITFINNGRLAYTGEKDALLESWRLAQGETALLTPELERKLVGTRVHSIGFEGLMDAREAKNFPGLDVQPASLDEIIVHICRGGNVHA